MRLFRFPLIALLLLTFAFALGTLSSERTAFAQDVDAEAHFKRGVALYQESDFKSALVEFRRAYEQSHKWQLLFNVGQSQYQIHDYVNSLSSFEAYLHEGGDKIPRARRTEVDNEIARLKERVGKVTIQSSVPGANVTIDGEVAGQAPLTRNVGVGERSIVVTKDGYVTWSRSVVVAGGDTVAVEASLVAITPDKPFPPPPPPPAPARTFPWPLWAVTGVLAVTTTTTGILALGASADLKDAKNRFDVTDTELHNDSTRAKTFAIVTDVLGIVTIASAAVALYFTIKSPSVSATTSSPSSALLHIGRF